MLPSIPLPASRRNQLRTNQGDAQWWPAEFFPKLSQRPGSFPWPRFGLGRRRRIHAGALLDRTTLLRIRETAYAPSNLPVPFLDRVRALEVVPDWLALDEAGPA